jgi:hypothetical protein
VVRTLFALAVVALVCATAALAGIVRPSGAAATHTTATSYCGEQRLFGYIRALTRHGSNYQLRFDPAQFLTGETANQAAAQDGAVPPGQPVPNDNYVVNETRRTYLYTATAATRIRVLIQGGNITNGNPVSVETLAQLVRGKHPVKLFEALNTGFWLGVHIDHACSLTQQYHP